MMLIRNGTWDKETEVVVVGFGSAGAAAALAAHEAGAQAVILEKQRFGLGPEAGNHYSTSHMSGGVFLQPTDREATLRYMSALSRTDSGHMYTPPGGWTEDDLLRAYTDQALGNKDWVEKMGAELTLVGEGAEHNFPGVETFRSYRFRDSGLGMMRFFEDIVRKKQIEVMYSTSAVKLLQNLDGEVVGVQAVTGEDSRKTIAIRSTKGVVLTLGGFEFDEQMKLNYLRSYPAYFTGSEACAGDGVRMVLDVGAQLWHMNCVSGRYVAKFPEFPNGITMWVGMRRSGKPCGFILVDKWGRRYTSERVKPHTLYYEGGLFDSQKLDFPRIPSYWIIDKRRIAAARLSIQTSGITGPMKRYVWSRDNAAEIERGWIISGDSPRDLAVKIGMDPDALSKTIATYNGYCAAGCDPDFNRAEDDLVPLNEPPYYAVRVWPGGPNTQGGAKRNAKAEILNVDGEPIPGLYSAGEFGSMFGMLYPSGGGNVSECFAFGRIAGENAAHRKV
ncbi:MAG: FAD-dependent oxidoreductase [Chloroflexota bacterium]